MPEGLLRHDRHGDGALAYPADQVADGFLPDVLFKKSVSAHQLYRSLGIGSYQSAWFMAHRIREAMRVGGLVPPMGGEGAIVEADETYYGRAAEKKLTKKRYTPYTKGGWKNKGSARPIVSLVERGGRVRSFHVGVATKDNVTRIVRENVAKQSRLHTDESRLYSEVGKEFAAHERPSTVPASMCAATCIRIAWKVISAYSRAA